MIVTRFALGSLLAAALVHTLSAHHSFAAEFDADKPVTTLTVRNTGDRPVQVGSHFHFFEAKRALEFDRAAAFGLHLNIPSSTAMRFEPGDQREVSLVPYGGKRNVHGFNNLVDGPTGGADAAVPWIDQAKLFSVQ